MTFSLWSTVLARKVGGGLQPPKRKKRGCFGSPFLALQGRNEGEPTLPLVSALGTGVSAVGPLERYADPLALSTGDLAARGLRCGMC
jgi:hypothetical protein